MTEGYHFVREWADLEGVHELTEKERLRIATIVTEQEWDQVVWLPEWLVDDKEDIEPVQGSDQVFVGRLEDYSDDAWRLWQPHRNEGTFEPEEFLPKSQSLVFEDMTRGEPIEMPQQGLGSFAGGES